MDSGYKRDKYDDNALIFEVIVVTTPCLKRRTTKKIFSKKHRKRL